MRKEKALTKIFRDIVDLISEESARNPQFANRMDEILSDITRRNETPNRTSTAKLDGQTPDIHSEWTNRGETEFRLWLKDQPIAVLRSIIRLQDFDPTHKTTKWKEADKLSDFITNGLRARLSRGSAFISRTAKVEPNSFNE